MIRGLVLAAMASLGLSACALGPAITPPPGVDPDDVLVVETNRGDFAIAMRPDLAPTHVARIKELARQGYYDGVVFHRVIDGFVAQTGDPTGTGEGGTGIRLKAEFTPTPHERGTVSMARNPDPDSGDSQWFICYARLERLDGRYTVWGKVFQGMEVVDGLKRGGGPLGLVVDPDRMIRVRVASDSFTFWRR